MDLQPSHGEPPRAPLGIAAEGASITLRFDRGTILFERAAAMDTASWRQVADDPVLERLPGVLWDPRSGRYRAPAFLFADLIRVLQKRGERVVSAVSSAAELEPDSWLPVELRPYQQAALGAWELAGRRGVLALPTGSGKTRVAIAAMARLGVPSLVLVPTRVLLHQWRAELERFFDGKVGAWGDGQREVASIMVITNESAYRQMHRLGRLFELLVVDEAHHFGVGRRDEALEMSVAPYRLGLTATPPSDPLAVEALERLVGPVVFQRSVQQLAGRYLADFDVVVLSLPLDDEERAAYEADQALFRPVHAAFRRVAPSARWADFVAAVQGSVEGQRALAAWRRMRRLEAMTRAKAHAVDELLARHRESKALVFTADNEAAYAVARRSLVAPITCDIGRAERDEVLGLFRSGQLRALVSARVLNEGIDVPDADVAIITGGSHGDREHIQRVGRLLRPSPGKRACVYELVAAGTSDAWRARKRRAALS